MLLALPIVDATAKVRTGWPNDEDEDYHLDIWAGRDPDAYRVRRPPSDPQLRTADRAPPTPRSTPARRSGR